MSEHRVQLKWSRTSSDFTYATYNRSHEATFKNNRTVEMSSAPAFKGDADRVDPEEMLVAALSSCHMLTFLSLAAKRGFVVDAYADHAVGHLENNASGRLAITRVELHPSVTFSGSNVPDSATIDALHHDAHQACFIANSVKTEVAVQP